MVTWGSDVAASSIAGGCSPGLATVSLRRRGAAARVRGSVCCKCLMSHDVCGETLCARVDGNDQAWLSSPSRSALSGSLRTVLAQSLRIGGERVDPRIVHRKEETMSRVESTRKQKRSSLKPRLALGLQQLEPRIMFSADVPGLADVPARSIGSLISVSAAVASLIVVTGRD